MYKLKIFLKILNPIAELKVHGFADQAAWAVCSFNNECMKGLLGNKMCKYCIQMCCNLCS